MTSVGSCRRVAFATLLAGATAAAPAAQAKITVNGVGLSGMDMQGTSLDSAAGHGRAGDLAAGPVRRAAPSADPGRLRLRAIRPRGG